MPVLLALATATALSGADSGAAPVDEVALVDESGYVEAVSRRRQRIETAPQAVAVITSADLVSTPAVTIPDRLRYVSGVDVYQSRHGQYDIGLSGWNGPLNNRMLVVLDGQEYRQEEFGSVNWMGLISPSDVRSIEVVKGGASVTYGANAFGGVVAIQERVADHRHRLYGTGYVASPGVGDVDATALGPLGEHVYYKVSAGGTRLDDLDSSASGLARTPSPRSAFTGDDDLSAARWRATLGAWLPYDHRIEATYRGSDQRPWEITDDFSTGSKATVTRSDDCIVALRGPILDVSWRHHEADKSYQNQKAFYIPAADYLYTQAAFADREDTVRGQVNVDTGANVLSFGGEWSDWRSASNLWDGDYLDPGTWKEVGTTNRAGFVEDQLRLSPRVALTAGLRADQHSVVGLHWSPRVALNWIPDREQFVLLSWSTGYRLPSPIEAFIEEYYFASSPDIDAEKVNSLRLSWQRRHRAVDLSYGADLFGSRASNLIMPMPVSGAAAQAAFLDWYNGGSPDVTQQPGPFLVYRNLDNPALLGGVEAHARGRLGDWPLWLWGNGTLQAFRFRDDLQFASDGFTLPGIGTKFRYDKDLGRRACEPPPAKANLGLDVEHGAVFGSLVGRAVAGRSAFSIANSDLQNAGYVDQRHVGGYVTCDITVGWRFSADKASFLRLAVLDLFDSTHYEVLETPPWALARDQEQEGQSVIGRSIALQGGFAF